jgi:hypothetical protein
MIVVVNIYKLLTLYYPAEHLVQINQIFLEIVEKNPNSKLWERNIDDDLLITLCSSLITSFNFSFSKEEEGLDDAVLKVLSALNQSSSYLILDLMSINFFSNMIIQKLNQSNKHHFIELLKNFKNVNDLSAYYIKDTFKAEIERIKLMSAHQKIDKEVQFFLKQLCEKLEGLNKHKV